MAGMSRISAMFTADTSGLAAGTRRAASSLQSLSRDVAALRSSMGTLVGINAAQLFGSIANGVATAARAFADMAGNSSETIDSLSKMAARLGVSYADMSGLALAADLAGVSVGTLAGAMTKADRAFVEAQRGSQTAINAFGRIGLSMDELGRLDPRERFERIAEAIAALPTEAERAAAAIALFGRSGAELLPLFSQGAAGIREAREQAERLGLTLTNVQGQNVEAMNDSWTLVRKSIEGVIQQVVANLAPAITAINEMWLDFVESTGGRNIGEFISDGLVNGAEYLASIADYFYSQLSDVWQYAGQVAASWTGVWKYGGQIASAFAMVGRILSTVFLGLVRTMTTPLLFVVEKIANLVALVPGIGDTAKVIAASVVGFRDGLDQSIRDNATAVVTNFNDMLGGAAAEAGQSLVGPFQGAVRDARQAMIDARNAANEPRGQPAADAPVRVEVDATKLVSAIDARSKEGVKEMLRLMYGGGNNIEEKQLAAAERTADGVEDVVAAIEDLGLEAVPL